MHSGGGGEAKFTAVSPKGTPPAVQLYSMAPRLDTLDGKTIYLVDTGFFGGGLLLKRCRDGFSRICPP